ncbi:MAG: hypothetical protein FD126_3046 [Elusimicrobia bacterium]|nr:MAG: hypothetical protein FD126_3046 [Elusimicrobiota bacterium]
MKAHALIAAAVLAVSAAASDSPESLRASGERSFGGLIPVFDPAVGAPELPPGAPVSPEPIDPTDPPLDPERPLEPVIRRPRLEAFPQAAGPLLGVMPLPERLDSHRDLLPLRLGAADWDVSIAADSKFDAQYLTFRRGETLLLRRLKDLNELRGAGVVVKIDDKTTYRFKVSINIFSPVRGSTLNITPEPGTQGPKHAMKTGALLDAIKRESFVFKAEGKEYWALFGTDVDPATDALANTRSLLIINEAGMSSKAWPVAESALPEGTPTAVSLENTKLVMTRGADGRLSINAAGKASPTAR